MPETLCLKRGWRPASATKKVIVDSRGRPASAKKKIIVDSSSSSEDESLPASTGMSQLRFRKSPNDSTASKTGRREPATVARTTPKQSTIDTLSSSDDDDSLLKPMVVTKRRRVTDSPSFLSRKAKSPTPSKVNHNSRATDDSSVETAELEKILLKPKPAAEPFTPTESNGIVSHVETRLLQNSHFRENLQAKDDSSEDTEVLAKILLGKHYSPATRNNQENSPTCEPTLPTEIQTAPPSNSQQYSAESESDNFELPEPDESSASSVASADSQRSENWENQKLPARVQPVHPNEEERRYKNNPYHSKVGFGALDQERRAFTVPQPRKYSDPPVNNQGGPFSVNVGGRMTEANASQTRRHTPDPSQLRLRDLREAALFDASDFGYDHSRRSTPSPTRGEYSSNRAYLQHHSEHSNDQNLRLEQAAFFGDSPYYEQPEDTPQRVRMGLHSPRQTPFSQVPPAQAGEQFRDDLIQDFSDEETAVQRFGRLASHALQQKRQSLLQTAPSQQDEMEPLSDHYGGPRRLRDASICNTAMSRSVVLRQGEGGQFGGGFAPRNDLVGGSGAGLTGFAFAPAPNGRGRGKGTRTNKKRSGGWKGRGRGGKSKGKKQGGTRGRGRGHGRDNTGFSAGPSSSTGGFSRGDDANLRHVGGAEFSF